MYLARQSWPKHLAMKTYGWTEVYVIRRRWLVSFKPRSFYNWGVSSVTTKQQDAWTHRRSGRGGKVISLAVNDGINATFNTVIVKSVRITGTREHTLSIKIRVPCMSTNIVWTSSFRSDKSIIQSATKYKLAHLLYLNVECTLVLSSFNQSWDVLTNVSRTSEYQISFKCIQPFSCCYMRNDG